LDPTVSSPDRENSVDRIFGNPPRTIPTAPTQLFLIFFVKDAMVRGIQAAM